MGEEFSNANVCKRMQKNLDFRVILILISGLLAIHPAKLSERLHAEGWKHWQMGLLALFFKRRTPLRANVEPSRPQTVVF